MCSFYALRANTTRNLLFLVQNSASFCVHRENKQRIGIKVFVETVLQNLLPLCWNILASSTRIFNCCVYRDLLCFTICLPVPLCAFPEYLCRRFSFSVCSTRAFPEYSRVISEDLCKLFVKMLKSLAFKHVEQDVAIPCSSS
jgi:hypothetical protein